MTTENTETLGAVQQESAEIKRMKMTAKTWKLEAEKGSGVLLNFAWVASEVRDDIVSRLALTEKVSGEFDTVALIISGDKGTVYRLADVTKDGKAFRAMKSAGGFTGWVSFSAFEDSGIDLKISTVEKVVASCKLARKVKREGAAAYDVLCDGAAKQGDGVLYYGSVRLVNGRALLWHEEHKRNDYNEHEFTAIIKDGMKVADVRATMEGAAVANRRKVATKKAKKVVTETVVTEETAAE